MNEQFKGIMRQANLEFGMKLNKISIYSMFPVLFLIIIGFRLSFDSVAGLLTYAYIISIIILIFSKMRISIKLRNLFAKNDLDEAKRALQDLINYFEQDTFFNRLFKKNQARLMQYLNDAYSMIKDLKPEDIEGKE